MNSQHQLSPSTNDSNSNSNSEASRLSCATPSATKQTSEAPSPSQPNPSLTITSTAVLPTTKKAIERKTDESENNKYTHEFLYVLYHGKAAPATESYKFECNYTESIACKKCSHTGHHLFHVHLCQYQNKSFTSILLVGPRGNRGNHRCWTGVEFAKRIHMSNPSYGMVGPEIASAENIESFITSRLQLFNEANGISGNTNSVPVSVASYNDDTYLKSDISL